MNTTDKRVHAYILPRKGTRATDITSGLNLASSTVRSALKRLEAAGLAMQADKLWFGGVALEVEVRPLASVQPQKEHLPENRQNFKHLAEYADTPAARKFWAAKARGR